MICGNIESFENRWGSSVNGPSFVISDDSASPVDQLNVVDEIEGQAGWHRLSQVADKRHE